MQRIKLLDSMRGLAASIAVFHHAYSRMPHLFSGRFPWWLMQVFDAISDLNVQAVLFFFFLSGFSICLSLKTGLPVTPAALNNYVYRRLKRICPLYYLAILFTLFAGIFTHAVAANKDYNAWNLFGNVVFLQSSKSYAGNWFAPYGENGPLWSLSFEMFYYFLLPPFLLFLLKYFNTRTLTPRLNRIALLFTLLISCSCIALNKLFFLPPVAFATLFYVWYAGFFSAYLYLNNIVKIDSNFLLLIVVTVVLMLFNLAAPSATVGKLAFGSAIATVFIPIFILRKGMRKFVAAVVETPVNFVFYWIGTGSYALYLLHFPVLLLLKHAGCDSLLLLTLSLAATAICCTWLESKFSKLPLLFLRRNYIK